MKRIVNKIKSYKELKADIVDINLEFSEERMYGRIILPDTANNLGPLYACLIRKRDE